eukprot:TRINITY_DN242_c0_g2_i2.p1 TRINITY_DN242_c0_g2~~TRINITY_DN242_c0_g2_i2.p1  ORF type:complete len:194 (+),score=20.17 TRINITY_DN242_c0_g2_i2:101-682(+)
MGKLLVTNVLLLFINLGLLLPSLACTYCPYPPTQTKPPKLPPNLPPRHPPKIKPPLPPVVKPPKPPKPPVKPKPPPVEPKPPVMPNPPPESPCPPPPPMVKPSPPKQETCPIDTLKLGACVDLLSGLVNIIIGQGAKDTCCPVLQGLADLDAALCLCTTIKAKLLNINLIVPIALELLIDCGKTPPPGYNCPA